MHSTARQKYNTIWTDNTIQYSTIH